MSSNLTKAGWLLLLVSLVLIGGSWYLVEIEMGYRVNKLAYFVGGGTAVVGGGAALLNKLGIEIMK